MSYSNYNHSHRRSRLAEPCQMTSNANLWTPTADQKHMLGAIYDTDDGRRFRYQKDGGSGLSIGLGIQSAAGTANWQNQAQTNSPSIPTVGDERVTVTLAATATKDQFADGYLTVEDGTGETNMYVIKGNKAGVANATSGYDVVCDIADAGGIRTAWEAASELTVTLNKYRDVIVFPTNPTGVPTGFALTAVTASYYFWAQTLGPCPCVVDSTDTVVVGDVCAIGPNTAGQIGLSDAAVEGDTIAGHIIRAAGATETAIVDLRLE